MQPNDGRPPRHSGSYEPLNANSALSRAEDTYIASIVRSPFGDPSSQKGHDKNALNTSLLPQGFTFRDDRYTGNGAHHPLASAAAAAAAAEIKPIAPLFAVDQCSQFVWRSYLSVESAALLFFSFAVSLDFASMAVSDLDENSPEYDFYFSCAFVSNILLCVASGLEARDTFVDFFNASYTGAVALGQSVATRLGCRASRESDGWSLNLVDRLIIPAFGISVVFVVPSCFSAFGIARDMQRDSPVALIQEYPVLSVLAMVLYTLVTRLSGTRGLIGEALESLCSLYQNYSCTEILMGCFLSAEGISRAQILSIVEQVDFIDQTSLAAKFSNVSTETFTAFDLLDLGFAGANLKKIVKVGKKQYNMDEKQFFRAGFDSTTFADEDENDCLSQARRHPVFKYGYSLVSLGLLYLTFSLQPFWLAKTKLDNPVLQWLGASASNFFYMRAVLNFLPALSQFVSKLHGSDYCWLLLLPFVGASGRSMSNEVAEVTCTKVIPHCTVYDNNTVAVNYADSVIGRVLSPEGLRDFGTVWTFFVAGLAANGVGAMHLKTHWPEIKRYFWQRWNHYQAPGEGGKPDVFSSPKGPFSYGHPRRRSFDSSVFNGGCSSVLKLPGSLSAGNSPSKRAENGGSGKVNGFVL